MEPVAGAGIELEALEEGPPHFPTQDERQAWLATYLAACREYQVKPDSNIVTCFRLGLPTLKLHKFRDSDSFKELEMQPLADTLSKHPAALKGIRTMNFANAKLGPSGVQIVATWISNPHCKVETVNLTRQLPGPSGLTALLKAVRISTTIKRLILTGCWLQDIGGELIVKMLEEGQEAHGLLYLDLENNGLSFEMEERINELTAPPQDPAEAAKGSWCRCCCKKPEQETPAAPKPDDMAREEMVEVNTKGNKVLDEVLNAVSHGIGVVLAIVATIFMAIAVRGKPVEYTLSVVFYSISLHVLYLSSCLFHSFLSMGDKVRHVFSVLDHAAIYFLIAGSYCPFVFIHLKEQSWLLYVLGISAFLGVFWTAFYNGPGKQAFETTLYLAMGWSCALYFGDLSDALGPSGTFLLVLGGLLYTVGVPFFVRQKKIMGVPDHTTWHMLVLAASVVHFICIYEYCLLHDPEAPKPNVVDEMVKEMVAFA